MRKPCPAGCVCAKHSRARLPREEYLRRNRERMADLRKRDPRRQRDIQVRSLYHISLTELEAMKEAQGHACALCGNESRILVIDHDHTCCTGKSNSCGKCIRGLICQQCNTALGMMGDDPELMRKAAAYVERSRLLQLL